MSRVWGGKSSCEVCPQEIVEASGIAVSSQFADRGHHLNDGTHNRLFVTDRSVSELETVSIVLELSGGSPASLQILSTRMTGSVVPRLRMLSISLIKMALSANRAAVATVLESNNSAMPS